MVPVLFTTIVGGVVVRFTVDAFEFVTGFWVVVEDPIVLKLELLVVVVLIVFPLCCDATVCAVVDCKVLVGGFDVDVCVATFFAGHPDM